MFNLNEGVIERIILCLCLRILECAKETEEHLIVIGDRHPLGLKEFEGIGITRIAGFRISVILLR